MKETKLSFLSEACGGELLGSEQLICGVKIDSRTCGAGDLFVCIVGENNNGHNFSENAFRQGTRAFLMSDRACALKMLSEHSGIGIVLVDNTVRAFELMAGAYLNQFDLIKIAITGSVGKTTTKNLVYSVVSQKYSAVCTQKNLNSDLGVSLTAFLADSKTQAIIFEMGMDGAGQIREYVSFAAPDIAVITNIGICHMEKLGSRDAIADAKLEICDMFNEESVLIVNADSDYLRTEKEIRDRVLNQTYFSIELVHTPVIIADNGLNGIVFEYMGRQYSTSLIGSHNALDCALAIAVGQRLGISYEMICRALMDVQNTGGRLSVYRLDNCILLDDSYNASPASVKAGIDALENTGGNRKIAVLSDMYELGSAEIELHKDIGRYISKKNIDVLIAVGNNIKHCAEEVKLHSHIKVLECEDIDEAYCGLLSLLHSGDIVLVKGSHGTGIYKLSQKLREYEEKKNI